MVDLERERGDGPVGLVGARVREGRAPEVVGGQAGPGARPPDVGVLQDGTAGKRERETKNTGLNFGHMYCKKQMQKRQHSRSVRGWFWCCCKELTSYSQCNTI